MPETTEQLESSVADLNVADGEGDVVDPWNVTSTSEAGVDYDKLISKPNFVILLLKHFKYIFYPYHRTFWLVQN